MNEVEDVMLDDAVRAYVRAARRLHESKGNLRDLQIRTQRLAKILCDERWISVQLIDCEEPLFDCWNRYETVDVSDWPTRDQIIAVYRHAHLNYEAARAAWAAVPDEGRRLVRGPTPRLRFHA